MLIFHRSETSLIEGKIEKQINFLLASGQTQFSN